MATATELATVGGGCFWCVEAVFQLVRGVERIVSGYAGGTVAEPNYKQVCSGSTGHAEVVQIAFDRSVLPYEKLIDLFFSAHDPTTLNRQGNDVGTQYRSVIFTHTADQQRIAVDVRAAVEREHRWPHAIVTEIVPLAQFYPAEAYHQNYFRTNPNQPYCLMVVGPKVEKWKKLHPELLRAG